MLDEKLEELSDFDLTSGNHKLIVCQSIMLVFQF